jgi:hypothetical protein
MLVPVLPEGPRLLALDLAKFHYTDAVLDTLRSYQIIPSMIPAGCTGLVQPLDVAVNKPFKDLLRDIMEELLDQYERDFSKDLREIPLADTSAIAERRVLVTRAVGEAWDRFCTTHEQLIISIFRKLGLTLPIDGSCDNELSVKGIDSSLLQIGDWHRKNGNLQGACEIEEWGNPGGPGDEDIVHSNQGILLAEGVSVVTDESRSTPATASEVEIDAKNDNCGVVELVDKE